VRLENMTPPHRSTMNDDDDSISQETRAFLANLSREDIATLQSGLPLIRLIIGFGTVSKWLAITLVGMMVGTVMLWDAALKIMMWFRGH
jgi:hypothetical protein